MDPRGANPDSQSPGDPEEPRGSQDLMAFYNLLRLYERLGKPGNYVKQLSDTNFSSYQWHRGPGCTVAPLLSSSRVNDSEGILPLSAEQLRNFRFQPGKVTLTEAEKGPLIDTVTLGELAAPGPDKEKRPRDKKDDEKKQKKAKKEKKESKAEKRKRSEEI